MKLPLGLLIGTAATALVVHYLNTEEGQALIEKIKKDAEELGANLGGLANDLFEKGKSLANIQDDTPALPVNPSEKMLMNY